MIRKALLATLVLFSSTALINAQEAKTEQSRPMMYMVADAHLDTQWRWDIQQTIGEFLPNTFLQNFSLIEQYPDYIFNFEGAVKYWWAKEYYPEMFEKLKKYISEGRWNVCGSSWDANDPNLPSIEASIRNFMYGQEFYKTEFGVQSHDVMLPDCFGFGYALPTIAAHCGLTSFHTQKLQWRARPFYPDGRKYPFRLGIWEGIDGSRLMACLDGGNYSWDPTNEDLADFSDFKDRIATSPIPAVYRYFGTRSSRLHDDQGGSPTPNAVRMFVEAMNNPKGYDLKFATTEQLFNDYYMDSRLPEVSEELLMDIHATGCYSSHSEMKAVNRHNEWALVSAEGACLMADRLGAMAYPKYTLDEGWKRVILHQFHDDLTGTSLPSAYRFSYNDEYVTANQMDNTIRAAVLASSAVLDTKTSGIPVVVYNPLANQSREVVSVEIELAEKYKGVTVIAPTGKKVNAQIVSREGNRAVVAFATDSKPVSISTYEIRPASKTAKSSVLKASGKTLENRIYKLQLDDNGDICSLVDKRCGRELVKEGETFGYAFFENNESNIWPAWEILKPVLDREPAKVSTNVKISVEELGQLRAVLRIEKTHGNSSFVQRIILTDGANDDRIDIQNDVDWQSRESLLKYSFPLNLSAKEASYDMGLGNLKRGNSTDLKYEVFAHQWADMTADDQSYGVTIMNNSKYGWDKPDDSTIRLTLHHTPTAKAYDSWQQTMDLGKHSYTFSICGHVGDLNPVTADIVADCLNQPGNAYVSAKHAGTAGKSLSALSTSSRDIRVKAYKQALDGDGIVVRTYELTGKGSEGEIIFDSPILSAEELNGIEESKGPASVSGNKLHVKANGFEPKTYRVRLAASATKAPASEYTALTLPYNAVVISSDAFSAFGHMDSEWHSYAAEIIPEDFNFAGVPYSIAEADYNNAVRCHAQRIALPEGTKTIHLLLASSEGDRDAVFTAGEAVTRRIGDFTGFYGYYGWDGYYEGVRRDGDVAYLGTHRHDSRKRNEVYVNTYMFTVDVPVSGNATELALPDDDRIVIIAATAEK